MLQGSSESESESITTALSMKKSYSYIFYDIEYFTYGIASVEMYGCKQLEMSASLPTFTSLIGYF